MGDHHADGVNAMRQARLACGDPDRGTPHGQPVQSHCARSSPLRRGRVGVAAGAEVREGPALEKADRETGDRAASSASRGRMRESYRIELGPLSHQVAELARTADHTSAHG